MRSLLLLRFCEIKCQQNCIWQKKPTKLYPNKNLCFFIMDISICLTVTKKIKTCLPSVHSKPWNPLSHPFMHVPLMWWHCSVSKQCPHCLLQFSPYVQTSQAAKRLKACFISFNYSQCISWLPWYGILCQVKSIILRNHFDATGEVWNLIFIFPTYHFHIDANFNKKQ